MRRGARVYGFTWSEGADRVLTGLRQSVVVDKGYAEKHGLGVGDKLAM
jgi:hypothetical protein